MDADAYSGRGEDSQSTCVVTPVDATGQLLARDVMQCGVVSIDRKAPVHKAVALLVEKNISGLPVTCEGRLAGMLSEKDLLRLLYESKYLPGVVEDYMTHDVTSCDIEDKLSVIHEHLVGQGFRRVPILYKERLAGMITRADLICVYKGRLRPPGEGSRSSSKKELLAEDAMKCGLLTVGTDTPLYDAMDMIGKHHITGLPVVDEAMNLLGLITEKDVLDCVDNPEAIGATVEPFMTTEVVSFDRKASLNEICACLTENNFHRVPILNGTRLMGVISRSDILKHRIAVFRR